MENEEKQMNTDVMELVLKEFTEEQKTTNRHIIELIKKSNELKEIFTDLEIQISKTQTSGNSDTKPFLSLLQNELMEIKTIVGNQPKNVTKKFQILLFPEQDAKLFYKIVFGRWFLWLVIMLALTNLYKWGVHYSDNQKKIEVEQLKNYRIRKSWKYLYDHSNKNLKKVMKETYEKLLNKVQ
jgi:hypothetical protein